MCTRRMNEVKALLADGCDVESIKRSAETFFMSLGEFKTAHRLVQEQLSDDIRENERIDWFEPKMATFENFMSEYEMWKNVQKDPQTLIEPSDSVSNVSKRSHKSRSSHSSSISSSVSSMRIKVTADKAALLARKAAFKKAALNMRLETVNLECDIAANDAKLKVFEDSATTASPSLQVRSVNSQQSLEPKDEMNEYLEKYSAENSKKTSTKQDQTSPGPSPSFEFVQLGAIPKTPLQRMFQPPKLNQVAHRKSNVEDATAAISDNPATTFQDPSVSCTDVGLTNMNISNVVRRQNDIAELLVLQQKHTLLPSREIPVFDGDPLNVRPFMQAF